MSGLNGSFTLPAQDADTVEAQNYCIPLIIAPSGNAAHFAQTLEVLAGQMESLREKSRDITFLQNNLKFAISECKGGVLTVQLVSLETLPDKIRNFRPGDTRVNMTVLLNSLKMQAEENNLPQLLGALVIGDRLSRERHKALKRAGEDFDLPVITIMHRAGRERQIPKASYAASIREQRLERGKFKALSRGSGVEGCPAQLKDTEFLAIPESVCRLSGPKVYAKAAEKGAIEPATSTKSGLVFPAPIFKKSTKTFIIVGGRVIPAVSSPIPKVFIPEIKPPTEPMILEVPHVHSLTAPIVYGANEQHSDSTLFAPDSEMDDVPFAGKVWQKLKNSELARSLVKGAAGISLFAALSAGVWYGLNALKDVMTKPLISPHGPHKKAEDAGKIHVYFNSGSAEISNKDKDYLKLMINQIKASPEPKRCIINGYSDSARAKKDFSGDGNKALSQKRAEALKQYLESEGIAADFLVVAYGDTQAWKGRVYSFDRKSTGECFDAIHFVIDK
ncbi:MAG: OmpA family protein [Alphaproteobacteria bacterium]